MIRKQVIDYKNLLLLENYTGENWMIIRKGKTSYNNRKKIAQAIKRARVLALMPFCDRHK